MTTDKIKIDEKYLECPECGCDAIPASEYLWNVQGPPIATWAEDDEADCPDCGKHLRANITDDECVEVIVVDSQTCQNMAIDAQNIRLSAPDSK